jgi:hypothetical protein
LTYVPGMPVGTVVKVRVKKSVVNHGQEIDNKLFSKPELWDWYCLSAPSVLRLRGKKKKTLKQSHILPAESSVLPRGWHRIPSSDYRTVHALLIPNRSTPRLTVNGIAVVERDKDDSPYIWGTDLYKSLHRWDWILREVHGTFGLRVPQFSIFDSDGNLPLNLQRTELTHSDLDFMAEAFEAQAKAGLRLFLTSLPELPVLDHAFVTAIRSMFLDEEILPIFLTRSGAGLLTQRNLREANVRSCLVVGLEQIGNPRLRRIQRRYDATIFFKEFEERDYEHDSRPPDPIESIPGDILGVRRIGAGSYFGDGDQEFLESGLIAFATESCPRTRLTTEDCRLLKGALRGYSDTVPHLIAAEVRLGSAMAEKEGQSVGKLWDQIIREPLIPFDPVERRRKLSHANKALIEYVADFASPKKVRKRRKS